MKILLTGASGFLGTILQRTLEQKHEVITLGRSSSSSIVNDLAEEIPSLPDVDMVIHAAGKAHSIPKSETEKREFFRVNERGTKNLLAGFSSTPKYLVFISTVAVYGREEGELIREDEPLNGNTPYALSKIAAENLIVDYGKQNRCSTLILRLPLVVGHHAPGNLGAIVKAVQNGYYFRLGQGNARKSMVLAADIADLLASWQGDSGIFNLTDGYHPTLAELDTFLAHKYQKKVKSVPIGLMKFFAKIGDFIPGFPITTYRINKLSESLTFSDAKARDVLRWNPRPIIENF